MRENGFNAQIVILTLSFYHRNSGLLKGSIDWISIFFQRLDFTTFESYTMASITIPKHILISFSMIHCITQANLHEVVEYVSNLSLMG